MCLINKGPTSRPQIGLPEHIVDHSAEGLSQTSDPPASLIEEVDSSEVPPGATKEETETQELARMPIVPATQVLLGVGTIFEVGQDEVGAHSMGKSHESCVKSIDCANTLSGQYPDSISMLDIEGKVVREQGISQKLDLPTDWVKHDAGKTEREVLTFITRAIFPNEDSSEFGNEAAFSGLARDDVTKKHILLKESFGSCGSM